MISDELRAGILAAVVQYGEGDATPDLWHHLDRCIKSASNNGSMIAPGALIGIALFVNRAGLPLDLLAWLGGGYVRLGLRSIPMLARGSIIGEAEWFSYYDWLLFADQNGSQGPRMIAAIRAGLAAIEPVPEPAVESVVTIDPEPDPAPLVEDPKPAQRARIVADLATDAEASPDGAPADEEPKADAA